MAPKEPWIEAVNEHFYSAFEFLYIKKKSLAWCISHTKKIAAESKKWKKIFFKQIKYKIVKSSLRQKLTKKCQRWLKYLSCYGLGTCSTKKFRKFVKLIKSTDQCYRYEGWGDNNSWFSCNTDSSSDNESCFEDNDDGSEGEYYVDNHTSYSYAYSEDDFEDDNDDDNQNDIANMSDFDNSHLSTLENDDKDNFENDDFDEEDEPVTDESENENDDTENGSDEDSDDDHDNDRSNYGSGDNNDQEESHNEYENDDTENGSDEDSDDDDNSITSESYSYAYSEDDFENDDFENDDYDDEDNADDESADVETDSPTQSSNVDTDLPYQSTDGPKHFRQFNMSSCQELIDYRQSALGALQPRLTGSCPPELTDDLQQEVPPRLNSCESTFSQFEENNSHEDKTKKMKRNSGVWSTQLTTATFEAQSAGLATHRQLSTKEDIADILIFENAKKQNKAPDKKRKAYIEEFYVFEKQHSCHWMQNLWKDRQSSCLWRQVCSVLVPRARRKCWNPGIYVRDISAT